MTAHRLSASKRLGVTAGHSFKADPGENGTLTANAKHTVSSSTVLLPTTANTGDRIEVLAEAGSSVTVKQGSTTVGSADNNNHLEVFYNGSDWVKVQGATVFEVYYSIGFEASTYADWPSTPSGCLIPMLRGSVYQKTPASDHDTATQAVFESNIIGGSNDNTDYIGDTFANFDGMWVCDNELWGSGYKAGTYGSDGDITFADLATLLGESVDLMRTACPLSRVGIWGLPSPSNYNGGSPEKFTAANLDAVGMWDLVDFVCPHVYANAITYDDQSSWIDDRIDDGIDTGLPCYPVIWDVPNASDATGASADNTHIWTLDDLTSVANAAKSKGCAGIIYWTSADFASDVTHARGVAIDGGDLPLSASDYYTYVAQNITQFNSLAVNFDPENANNGNALTVPA